MSPLEAAREMVKVAPIMDDGHCLYCDYPSARGRENPHDLNCPWLMLPQIVAALEAAEAYIIEMEGQGERIDVLRRVQAYDRLRAAL